MVHEEPSSVKRMQAKQPAVNPDELYRRRLAEGLSLPELAEKAGVCAFTIYRVAAGFPVRLGTLRKVARALRCDPLDLLPPSVREQVLGGAADS